MVIYQKLYTGNLSNVGHDGMLTMTFPHPYYFAAVRDRSLLPEIWFISSSFWNHSKG